MAAGDYNQAQTSVAAEYLDSLDRAAAAKAAALAEERENRMLSIASDALSIAREDLANARSSAESARLQARWAVWAAIIATVAAIVATFKV